jgi:hypothetical protein
MVRYNIEEAHNKSLITKLDERIYHNSDAKA